MSRSRKNIWIFRVFGAAEKSQEPVEKKKKKWSKLSLRVHVIKATQYTGLKATPKNTGKKATKIYRNIGYNEYTGSKATAFLNTQEKRLHFLNIPEKRLRFSNIQEKGYTF